MTYCTRCGARAVGYRRFCALCGARIVDSDDVQGMPSGDNLAGRPPPAPQSAMSSDSRRVVTAGMLTFGATVVLSAALAVSFLSLAASLINAVIAADPSISTTQTGPAPNATDVVGALQQLVIFTSYTFFASHFGALEASSGGGATYLVSGVGSLTIALVAILLPFGLMRRIERSRPDTNAGAAFMRGSAVALPYGAAAAALYVASVALVAHEQLIVSVRPSFIGVLLAAALVGLGGGLGAASVRVVNGDLASALVRAVSRATAATLIGIVLTTLVAITWIGIEILTTHSSTPSTTVVPPAPALNEVGWSFIALIPFYILNMAALAWSAALSGTLFSGSSWHPVIYVGMVSAAFVGSLYLPRRANRIERASYAGVIALETAVIAVATTPAVVNGPSLVPGAWTAVLTALVAGSAAALTGPHLVGTPVIRKFAYTPPVTWAMKPLLALWPRDPISHQAVDRDNSPSLLMPLLSRHVGAAATLLILLAGTFLGASYISAGISRTATARDLLAHTQTDYVVGFAAVVPNKAVVGEILATVQGIENGNRKPSITAVALYRSISGSYEWQITGRHFTPRSSVTAFLYEPYNAATWTSSNKPGLLVRADGTFTGNFELYVSRAKLSAMIRACDDSAVCATVLVTTP
jgi:hypothetical protein